MPKALGWACILAWAALCLRAGGAAADAKKTSASPKTSAKPGTKKGGAKAARKKKAAPSKAAGTAGKQTTSSAKTASGGTSATPAAAGAKSAAKAPARKGAASKRGKQAPKVTWRNRQTEPTPQRYKEIQDALAAKGFLDPADASGAWGQSSMDALRKFQAAQSIEATGKIDSLSLIALGLGPKREAAVKVPASPPEQAR